MHTDPFKSTEQPKISQKSIFMAYIADVVGIAPGLEELRHIRRQRVFLMDLLQTLLVEELQGKILKMADITCMAPLCK